MAHGSVACGIPTNLSWVSGGFSVGTRWDSHDSSMYYFAVVGSSMAATYLVGPTPMEFPRTSNGRRMEASYRLHGRNKKTRWALRSHCCPTGLTNQGLPMGGPAASTIHPRQSHARYTRNPCRRALRVSWQTHGRHVGPAL